jgi:DNA-binding IclR family transcriptional regulator
MDELVRSGRRDALPVKSAMRALEILELLTAKAHALSFSEFQSLLGYPKASLHGLLRTMTAAHWIEFDSVTRRYVLGVRVWQGGIAYSAMVPLERRARPMMERVRSLTTETVQLAVLDHFEVLYIGKVDGKHMLRLDSSVGLRLKAHATGVGKVLLAGLPDDALVKWLEQQTLERYTSSTITDPARLIEELRIVRRRGHAIDEEERTLGACCVAVGIHDDRGNCIAAMSVSAPAVRFGDVQRGAALRHLQVAADELSAALGYAAMTARDGAESEPSSA